LYNTSFIFAPDGAHIATHRKVHLFDIDIERGIRFKESDTFTAGSDITVFDTELGKIGVAVCFDIRFPEMFREMKELGADLFVLPGSFNMTTGPLHWQLLIRARALDNQCYMAACSPARDYSASYLSYGHSMVCDPYGELVGAAAAAEAIVYADIDPEYTAKARREIPIGN
jgi:predicted amidohydrolase